ncbi:hypothetical protein ACVWZD_007158 [Streptomyces sp. TE3672]
MFTATALPKRVVSSRENFFLSPSGFPPRQLHLYRRERFDVTLEFLGYRGGQIHRADLLPFRQGEVQPSVNRLYLAPDVKHAAYIEVISIGEPAVADEGAGDAGEGEEVLGFAFVAAVESAAAGEPGRWVGRAVRCLP